MKYLTAPFKFLNEHFWLIMFLTSLLFAILDIFLNYLSEISLRYHMLVGLISLGMLDIKRWLAK